MVMHYTTVDTVKQKLRVEDTTIDNELEIYIDEVDGYINRKIRRKIGTFNEYGYEKSVIIIGYQLSANADYAESIVELYQLIKAGILELRIPKKGFMHEKFFITTGIDEDGSPFFHDICGSSNPTMSGSGKRGNQSNQ